MTLEERLKIVNRQWDNELKDKLVRPNIYITSWSDDGARMNSHLDYLKIHCGLEIKLDPMTRVVTDYKIIDSEKFMWFVLKWS